MNSSDVGEVVVISFQIQLLFALSNFFSCFKVDRILGLQNFKDVRKKKKDGEDGDDGDEGMIRMRVDKGCLRDMLGRYGVAMPQHGYIVCCCHGHCNE